jgi:hypothetical protein
MATVSASFDVPESPGPRGRLSDVALRWSVISLTAITWISSGIFAFFLGAIPAGTLNDWNDSLPNLYARESLAATIGIGVHFGLGAILLLLGPVQLIARIRQRWPRVHHVIGWTYASAAIVTGLGGLSYIVLRGTIGGPIMSFGFGFYGGLMVVAGVQTLRHAIARRIRVHRAWAVRLYALAIGSWLYRMDYGLWFLFAGKLGTTKTFSGPVDHFMIFWFFVPNLIIAELILRTRGAAVPSWAKATSAAAIYVATAFIALGTYYFTAKAWGPGILWRMGLIAG